MTNNSCFREAELENGNVLQLKTDVHAMEKQFQEEIGVSASYDWSFCLVEYDGDEDSYVKDSFRTFDDFAEADKVFVEETGASRKSI